LKPLILLGRPGCHLCEEFLADLLQAFPLMAERVTQANVDDNPDWHLVYGVRIPVLLSAEGEVLAEGRFSPDKLRALPEA